MIKIILSLTLLFSFLATASTTSFHIDDVDINCLSNDECFHLNENFKSLKRNYVDLGHFKNILKLYVANAGVKELSYSLDSINGKRILYINAIQKKKIKTLLPVIFKNQKEIELPPVLPIREEEFLDNQKIKSTIKLISDVAKDKGYPDANIEYKIFEKKSDVDLQFIVDLGRPIIVGDLTINSASSFIKRYVEKKVFYHIDSNFDIDQLKIELEKTKELLQHFGYYLIDFDFKYRFIDKYTITLYVDVKNTTKYVFYLKNSKFFSDYDLKLFLKNDFKSSNREQTKENLEQALKDHYEKFGFLNVKIKSDDFESIDIHGDRTKYYNLVISEHKRSKIDKIRFKGNNFYSRKKLLSFYEKFSSEQASNDYYDFDNYQNYAIFLKDKYIQNGFVSVLIEPPTIQIEYKTNKPSVLFKIREGVRSKVSSINIKGLTKELEDSIRNKITLSEEQYFNPVAFKSDLEMIQTDLLESGYYHSRITNLNDERSLVKYKYDNSAVEIDIDIDVGVKMYVNDIIILGNSKTRKILIKRELDIREGDLISTQKLNNSKNNLLRLGLFSSVQIQPVSKNRTKTDLLVYVREKDFGSVEIAPGVRSDIGLKISAALNYNNIDGMNKRISLKGTLNRRFDLNSLDERRRKESSSLLEYDTSADYSENHLFHSDYDFGTTLTFARKRFYSFDADIQRIGYSIGRDFSRWFRTSFRQQIERISQFDATLDDEDGHFQIGSFTPSFTFDFRNRSINPTSGALLEISNEIANNFFFSENSDELKIDYYKLISRNKFYLPLSDRVTLAMSGTFGIQENKATNMKSDGTMEGYIPNIKVFRLSGSDIIRGFDDTEMNTLVSGQDISEVRVNSRAYMVNFKIEPRYNLSDTTVFGLFYDAGRIFINELDMGELRSSVGFSFKYLTPVGTLDFDYGIKLLRKEDSSGRVESPGRLHVSIGFF